jgi:hypothetical protein
VTTLKDATIQDQLLKFSMMSIVAVTAVVLALLIVPEIVPGQVSAQITPSSNAEPSNAGIGFMAQNSADPVQNSTSANITQLATIFPAANQPITPATFTPVSEPTGDSDDSSSSNDDDESDSSSNDNDSDNSDNSDDSDDSDDSDNDGDGGGSSASAGGGGAFAFAG